MSTLKTHLSRARRARRTRARLHGTAACPRLSVFRSSKFMYAQVINDDTGRTLAFASDQKLKGTGSPMDRARAVGTQVAQVAKAAGIERVVFDRGAYAYHGRVAALADAAREAGLTF